MVDPEPVSPEPPMVGSQDAQRALRTTLNWENYNRYCLRMTAFWI